MMVRAILRFERSFPAIILAVLLLCSLKVLAYERCSKEAGSGFCPTGNTCCSNVAFSSSVSTTHSRPHPLEKLVGGGGCIPNDLGSYHGTCCLDRIDTSYSVSENRRAIQLTGCGVGFTCSGNETCRVLRGATKVVDDTAYGTTGNIDPLVMVLPRYKLGRQITGRSPPPLHGFPLHDSIKLAYFSSHGDVTRNIADWGSSVKFVFLVIHGAGRNADDYFCVALSAVQQQITYSPAHVLVLAPYFAGVDDPEFELDNGGTAMRWNDNDDGSGPWRYGDDAWTNESSATTKDGSLSSFRAIDLMIEWLVQRLPSLHNVVVAGHSSGGQFVQRWSLLTPVWWSEFQNETHTSPQLHSVVANPSSYAYLTLLRRRTSNATDSWQLPTNMEKCPNYNQWEWGLELGGNFSTPYFEEQLRAVGGAGRLIDRFRNRRVIYLVGGQDRCNVSGNDGTGWCYSHGLETSCMDNLQGRHRLERFNTYLEMLAKVGLPKPPWAIVPGVGHDHSLMFQSEVGIQAIFGASMDLLYGSTVEFVS